MELLIWAIKQHFKAQSNWLKLFWSINSLREGEKITLLFKGKVYRPKALWFGRTKDRRLFIDLTTDDNLEDWSKKIRIPIENDIVFCDPSLNSFIRLQIFLQAVYYTIIAIRKGSLYV